MDITRLAVKGFRSLKDVEWKPGKLNVLIGPNGGGKTNLLKLLQMLAATTTGGLAKFIQREGGMEQLVWDGAAREIEIDCSCGLRDSADTLQYQLTLGRAGGWGLRGYSIEREILKATAYSGGALTQPPLREFVERTESGASFLSSAANLKKLAIDDIGGAETALSLLNSRLVDVAFETLGFQYYMSKWAVYDIANTAAMRQPIVVSFEGSVQNDGTNLIAALHTAYNTDRNFKNELNLAMKAAFGDEFDELVFPPAADQRIQLRIRWKSLRREQSAADLSEGTLRFLFLLTVLASPSRPDLFAIEEPEIGLHPSMLRIVAEFAAEASRSSQVIFTTHSPAFLDAIGKHDVTVTVVESQHGETNLKNVSGEEMKYWLDQFTLGQVYRSGQLESLG